MAKASPRANAAAIQGTSSGARIPARPAAKLPAPRRREEDPLTAQPKGYHGDHGDGCYRAFVPPEEER